MKKQFNFALVVLILSLVGIDGYTQDKPNVILIMTDDQGYGDLSCHGNPVLKTPNLDKLHAESIRFTDFHVSSYCTPTRASLLTGHYHGYTGAWRTSAGRSMMHRDEKTIANLFADAGYTTGMVGKWHLGDNAPHRPQDRGFQDALWHRCGGVGQASDYWGNDYFDDVYERNGKFEKFEGHCTDVWFEEGLRFIEKNKDRPFFLYVSTNAPHHPYNVAEEWVQPYENHPDVATPGFYGLIAQIDKNVGTFRKRLTELGLDKNTILVFMTDNGTDGLKKFKALDAHISVGYNAGMRGRKSSVYEGGHRVPFFIYWPKGGLTGGQDIDRLTGHIDVLPTLADLCGITIPQEYQPHGVTFKPLLYGEDEKWTRDHLVEQFLGRAQHEDGSVVPYQQTVVMTEQWRLVNSDEECLYDIQKDPGQYHNVIDDYPEVANQLRKLYDPYWETIAPRLGPVRIDIGNPTENPAVLCSQNWRVEKGSTPWNFNQIKNLPRRTGPWMLEVLKAGRYKITLRQYPKEADKELVGVRAEMEISGQKLGKPIEKGSRGIVFEVDLDAGPAELLTWIYDENGEAGGAYFTEVEAL